jgi:hypothetical protein
VLVRDKLEMLRFGAPLSECAIAVCANACKSDYECPIMRFGLQPQQHPELPSWDPQIQTDPGRRDILTTFNRGYPRPWPIEER